MRRDLQKVIFERAKAYRTWASKTPRRKAIQLDAAGDQFDESGNHRRVRRQKMGLNAHYAALTHFLRDNLGRPWNKVFAEICERADSRTLLGEDIRAFAFGEVECNCWLEGRTVMTVRGPVCGFYAHPKTGLLQRTPDRPRRRKSVG